MPAYDDAWIDAVCAACDPVFESADVGFVRQLSLSDPGQVAAILWEAEPLLFASRYPDSGVRESYGDQWPPPCIDQWLYFEPELAQVRLSLEGWDLPEIHVPVTGHGSGDGVAVARLFARILAVPAPG